MTDVPLPDQRYGGLLTFIGEDKEANYKVLGKQIEFTHVAVGDGNGRYVEPDQSMTKLVNEIDRYKIDSIEVYDKGDGSAPILKLEAFIPPDDGGFTVRELGAYDVDGQLIAVANCAPNYKPTGDQNSPKKLPIRLNFAVTSREAWQVTINDDLVMASRDYVNKASYISKDVTREVASDTFGRQLFYGDACKVVKGSGGYYDLLPGEGYVVGIRFDYPGKSVLVSDAPTSIWLDVSQQGNAISDIHTSVNVVVSDQEQVDYVDDAGVQHYLEKISSILPNSVVSDDRMVLRTNGLFSERVLGEIDVRDFGAIGNGVTDNTAALQACFEFAIRNKYTVRIPRGVYEFTRVSLNMSGELTIKGDSNTILHSTLSEPDSNKAAIRFSGSPIKDYSVVKNGVNRHDASVTMEDTAGIQPGDLAIFSSNQLIDTDHRGFWKMGFVGRVSSISGNKVTLEDAPPVWLPSEESFNITVTEKISASQFKVSGLTDRRGSMYPITGISGNNSGEVRNITDYDPLTNIVTCESTWLSPPEVGDVFRLDKLTQVRISRPLTVSLSGGVTLTRDKHLTANAGDGGFLGLQLQENADSTVEDWSIENFSETNFKYMYSYKSVIRNCKSKGANRIYSGYDGTGYGLLDVSSYRCQYLNNDISFCRCGFTTAGAVALSVYSVVRDNRITGGGVSYTGEGIHPHGNQVSYGFGGHGNAYHLIYSNNYVNDCHTGGSYRDYMPSVLKNEYTGSMEYPFYLHQIRGGIFKGNIFKPITKGEHFVELRGGIYNAEEPLIISENVAYELEGAFVGLVTVTDETVLENLHVTRNTVHFNKAKSQKVGIFGTTTGVRLSKCRLSGNIVHYTSAADDTVNTGWYGFATPNRTFKVVNDYIITGENQYFVNISSNNTIEIPFNNGTATCSIVDIVGENNGIIATSVVLYEVSGNSGDQSPLGFANTNRVYPLKSNELSEPKDGFVNIYQKGPNLIMINKHSSNLNLFVSIKRVV
ncbi:phage tail protein [Endozoicomonas montiporae]|uniref:phage tail-collar fiber domain-containing protein n=1 Tax=Endozoicomonas montiporae TaxID=1027273 RepID=UPI00069122C7|nr:phage tail protein [Endozoicomonas montiporae]